MPGAGAARGQFDDPRVRRRENTCRPFAEVKTQKIPWPGPRDRTLPVAGFSSWTTLRAPTGADQ